MPTLDNRESNNHPAVCYSDSMRSVVDIRRIVLGAWQQRAILAILAIFIVTVSLWIKWTPYKFFGDEEINYHYNIGYILKHHNLPVSGRDDLQLLTGQCGESLFGQYPCPFSYQTFPPVNYILAAGVAKVTEVVSPLQPYVGARIASLLFGAAFILWLYGSLVRLRVERKLAAIITVGAGFIPQVLAVSAYPNADSYSLAVTAGLAFTMIGVLQHFSLRRAIWFGILLGLFLTVKYNFFLLLLPVFGIWLAVWRRKLLTSAQLKIVGWCVGAGALVLASPWYIRNLVLYGDPVGVSHNLELMARYKPLGTAYGLTYDSIVFLLQHGFFGNVAMSFFAHFSPEKWPLPGATYEFLLLALLGGGVYFVFELWMYGARREKWLFTALAVLGVGTLFLVVWNAVQYTYQAQGRYLFPLLVPTALAIGYVASRNRRFLKYPLAWGAIIVVLFLQANWFFAKSFLNEDITPTLKDPRVFETPPPELDWRVR